MDITSLQGLLLTLFMLFNDSGLAAQDPRQARDSLPVTRESLLYDSDSVVLLPDTVNNLTVADTTPRRKTEPVDSPVDYTARDSIVYALNEQKIFLFGEAEIKYQDITLKSEIIEFDMGNEVVFARGVSDTMGILKGQPVFSQGSETFEANTLFYNLRTKKGIIKQIYSKQEGGFLHSEITKRQPDGEIDIKNGKYTTCDLQHPHFYIALTKAKSIPKDKIVSGPAYFVIEDVPLPVGIPFGFFPSTRTSKSGILIPQYGEESRRGFYLRNGGYYLALCQYADMKITADIYTNGTWGATLGSTYRKRYKFTGNVNFRFFENVSGERGLKGFKQTEDYAVIWSHTQDGKANPTRRFSASVNFSTSSYDKLHTRNINNVMRSTKQSNISFSKVWPNSPFNFNASMSASQNTIDRSLNLRMPQMALNMNRIYPFRSKNRTGKTRWYEDIQISYSSTLENRLNTRDTLLFSSKLEDFDYAYQHNIPVSMNFKALNYFTISPNLRYTGVVFGRYYNPEYRVDYQLPNSDIRVDTFMIDTIQGLRYAHAYVPSLNINFSPKIFGIFQFKEKSSIEAIRHVITPRAGFSYTPDMKGIVPDYYKTVQIDSTGKTRAYPLFDETIYRIPVLSGRQGSVSLSLMNNIEMKVKSKTDTVEEYKKIKLLDNFNFSTRYDIFKDSLNWSPISMTGNTNLFNKKISINFNGILNPYSYMEDKYGNRRMINASLWKDRHALVRLTNFNFSTGMSLKSAQKKGESDRESPEIQERTDNQPTGYEDIYYGQYVDFNIPWSLRLDYNFNYTKTKKKPEIVQSFRVSGDLNLTPKWKIGFNSGYDFTHKKISLTNINIYRDLHCWEMQITMVPFGTYRSYSFQINIKSSILKDVKYELTDNWYDNF